MHKKNYFSLPIWMISVILIGFLIGRTTNPGIDTWYQTLKRSPLTPPNWIFATAWTILYGMIGASGWYIWNKATFSNLKTIKFLYKLQLLLNYLWSPLFFTLHLIGTSALCLIALLIIVFLLIKKTFFTIKPAALLLIPYFFWLLFASYLIVFIWKSLSP